MPLAQDALSTGGSGTNGVINGISSIPNGTTGFTTSTTFISPSAAASLLLFFWAINDSLAAVGTVTAKFDPTGTNQTMSSLGSVEDSAAGVSLFGHGLVVPGTSGGKAIKITYTGTAATDVGECFAISYTGSVSSSVAAATEGFNTATGTSATASVTTGASIPSGDLEIAWMIANGSSFNSTINTTVSLDATFLGVACSKASGAGATINSTGAIAASTTWAAMTVGVKAAVAVPRGGTLLTMGVGWRKGLILPDRRIRVPKRRVIVPLGFKKAA